MTLAIDIGGTKTLVALVTAKGDITHSLKFPTPNNYSSFLQELDNTVKVVMKKAKQAPHLCIVAIPGRVDRKQGRIIVLGNLEWHDKNIAHDITKLTGFPTHIENDANLAALAEAHEYPRYRKVLYLTVSTGIGDGYIVNGVIDASVADSEAGHMLLEHDGELKEWESFASGRAIVARYGKRASDIKNESVWKVIAHDIALGLIDLVAVLGPDAIIIGGGVGSHFDKFGHYLKQELQRYRGHMIVVPPLFKAKHPEEAVIYGCHTLATQIAHRAAAKRIQPV